MFPESLIPVVTRRLKLINFIRQIKACLQLHQNKWKRWKTTLLMIPTAFIYGNMQAALTVWARLRMICGMEWAVTRRKLKREDVGC